MEPNDPTQSSLTTPQHREAFDALENGRDHVFITGEAGTGKSTFLTWFRRRTNKKTVILAPTGVAALHVKGQTIHSFFRFKPDVTPVSAGRQPCTASLKKIIDCLDMIIIDEVSMLRADLMDTVDVFLRTHGPRADQAFGGIQMVLCGDLHQLAPVVTSLERDLFNGRLYDTPYFFSAKVFNGCPLRVIEFTTPFRQNDPDFLALLNRLRLGQTTREDIDRLNERVLSFTGAWDELPEGIVLTTTNKKALTFNQDRLNVLDDVPRFIQAHITGECDARFMPTDERMLLKKGAQIMLLNNDPWGRWVNGSLGRVTDIETAPETTTVSVHLFNGIQVDVEPHVWELYRYRYDDESHNIVADVVGTFRQLPLKLAWAVTIHKSQGKTFDAVNIDLGEGAFCHGQVYVALSRCRSLEGVRLLRPIHARDILVDERILRFVDDARRRWYHDRWPVDKMRAFLQRSIREGRRVCVLYQTADHKVHTVTGNGERLDWIWDPRSQKKVEALVMATENREPRGLALERILDASFAVDTQLPQTRTIEERTQQGDPL